jgi:hypothetical protein
MACAGKLLVTVLACHLFSATVLGYVPALPSAGVAVGQRGFANQAPRSQFVR